MILRRFLYGFVAVCLLAGCAAAAPAPKPAAKSTAKKSNPRAKSTAKGKKTARARRSGPPRQQNPTPERYMEFQQALADRGYYTGPVNGTWGPDSIEALKRFQQDQNLAADGKLGSLSIIALGLGPKREPATAMSVKPATRPDSQQ